MTYFESSVAKMKILEPYPPFNASIKLKLGEVLPL